MNALKGYEILNKLTDDQTGKTSQFNEIFADASSRAIELHSQGGKWRNMAAKRSIYGTVWNLKSNKRLSSRDAISQLLSYGWKGEVLPRVAPPLNLRRGRANQPETTVGCRIK